MKTKRREIFYTKQIQGGCYAVRNSITKRTIDIVVTKEDATTFAAVLNHMRNTLKRVIQVNARQ